MAARTILRVGDTGAAVAEMQGLLGVATDGSFGPMTEGAVRRFQQRNGLTVDGVVGPATWAKLRSAGSGGTGGSSGSGGRPLLQVGDTGAAVAELQALLGVAADGIFGPMTEGAVRRFQQRNGLMVDGVVGPATWARLLDQPDPPPFGDVVLPNPAKPVLWTVSNGLIANDPVVIPS